MDTTPMDDINALVNSLLGLGLDITKAYKAKASIVGYAEEVASDAAVMASLKIVIENISKLPSDFKSMTVADGLSLIAPVVTGVEAIIAESKA